MTRKRAEAELPAALAKLAEEPETPEVLGEGGAHSAEVDAAFAKLTVKEAAFVRCYIQHGNATRAAEEAGYAAKTRGALSTKGYELLKKSEVAATLGALAAVEDRRAIMSVRERKAALSAWARGERGDPVTDLVGRPLKDPTTDLPIEAPAPVKERRACIAELNRMDGIYVERHEHTGKDGGPIKGEVTWYLPENPRFPKESG